jgi:hypothetical protein
MYTQPSVNLVKFPAACTIYWSLRGALISPRLNSSARVHNSWKAAADIFAMMYITEHYRSQAMLAATVVNI